jgi:glycine cleavage system H protein
MPYPGDRKYTKDHEWVRLSGAEGEVGITDYAQKQLGDVVYIELPEVGRRVMQGEVFGTIESVKAVSELFSPASGEVVDRPETVNSDPHGTWMIKLKLDNPAEASGLLDGAQYADLVK